MIEAVYFEKWLNINTSYTDRVKKDILSRIKRADHIREYSDEVTYIFYLEKEKKFQELTVSVKSQIRKAVVLYQECMEVWAREEV